ncbi:SDR family NAD(P)-dependent oxidoreductase [Pseudonocardia kongjuensis]|uniref:SDR family NAD(P)-dependent oxidoreductase n=1 Tax=Pseudonocardia kongjuensis TaxID=102227 RepID=A0ABP4I4C1_9PSEU
MTPQANPSFRLDGRVAVVTGASSGLGLRFAGVLAAAGADVVVGARRADGLAAAQDAVRAAGRRCVAVPTDVTDDGDCARLADAAVRELGRLDVLVNNAGTGYAARAESDDDPGRAAALFAVNLLGAYRMAVHAGRAMIAGGRGGSIVNIGSALGSATGPLPEAAYSASKAGIAGLTRDLAAQWSARHGIRVNTLAPGWFASELTGPLLASDGHARRIADCALLGRIGRPDELDGPLLLLASDAGSYLTGTTLAVDGGWSAR